MTYTTLTTFRFSSGRGTTAEIPLHNDTVSTQNTVPAIRCISRLGLKKDATKKCSRPKENTNQYSSPIKSRPSVYRPNRIMAFELTATKICSKITSKCNWKWSKRVKLRQDLRSSALWLPTFLKMTRIWSNVNNSLTSLMYDRHVTWHNWANTGGVTRAWKGPRLGQK